MTTFGGGVPSLRVVAAGPEGTGDVLLELGIILLVLALLGRIAAKLGIPSIPLYLLAGLIMGEGGFIPINAGEEFLAVGAQIGVRAAGMASGRIVLLIIATVLFLSGARQIIASA